MLETPQTAEVRIRTAWERADYEQAATLLIETYGPEIRRFLNSKVGDRTRAADIYGAVLMDVWRGLKQFQFRCTARSWTYTLARYAAC